MNKRVAFLSFALLLMTGACSSMPAMPKLSMPAMPSFGPAPAADTPDTAKQADSEDRKGVGRAIDLLGAGRADEAKVELQAALAANSKDAVALRLLEQIEKDPTALLGPDSEPYVIVAGDTMSGLAEQHLGDSLLFYALSRYNGLASPNALSVGKTLRIPVRPGRTPAKAKTSTVSAPAARAVDAEKASATRLQALELLNRGDVARAVTLLKEAQSLNAADAAISRDLDRALRIQSALKNG